jgi:glycerol-3-phosphate O-acyltransferase
LSRDVYDIVLSYEKVRKHLANKPEDKAHILKMIDEIKGEYSFKAVGSTAKFLDSTFLKLYDDVNLEVPEGSEIKKLQEDYHVILVPNHQSHADYIALQYILYKKSRTPVYIAAGVNLNIFPIGKLFRKCGAFFIRRRFDDELYKIAFQGYIYYLLKTDKAVEFFFEGGRTRTGKLLPPKYGLFSMLLDAHQKFDDKKPLMFIPVSIAHEMIPEEKAHAKELEGRKKEKEKTTQLLKLYKLFNKKLGTVHVRFGKGIIVDEEFTDLKSKTQELAFECFRAVGRGMPITPSSLLSLILLDDPAGALTWKQIESRAIDVIDFCDYMNIPTTKSLNKENLTPSLKVAMDMFINNKKVELLKREKLNQVFYTITDESRVHLLYHKNMILHHFIVPGIINATWFNIFNGNIKSASDLTKFLILKRKELKYEFYLPTVKEMIHEALRVVEFSTDEKLTNLADALEFPPEKLYKIAQSVRRFSTAFSYIYEAYYTAAIALKYIGTESFTMDKFLQISSELFSIEKEHGHVVKYPESFTVPKMKTTLKYFENLKVIRYDKESEQYTIVDIEKVNGLIEKFARDVNDQVAINLKFNQHE